jgi:uncharacterized protein
MPIEIDPVKTALQRSDYSGIIRLEDLKQLKDIVVNPTGIVTVNLSCKHDEQGLVVLLVDAQTDVQLTCERCGGPFDCSLSFSETFTPENKKIDEDLIPSHYEIVSVDEHGLLNFRELVEGELILSAPIIPKHDDADCGVSQDDMSWGDVGEEEPTKPNPFEILQNLKVQKD